MRYIFFFLMFLSAFTITPITGLPIDQKLDTKLNNLQQSITQAIQQSNLDSIIAEELINQANDLNEYLRSNIQQDITEIRIAAAITSLLESIDKLAQNSNATFIHQWLSPLKYAARTNVMHKLLIGMYPGKFKDEQHYTSPYIESIGFIANNWAINSLFTIIFNKLALTSVANTLQLDVTSLRQKALLKIIAGLVSHYSWVLEKKSLFDRKYS